MIGRLPPPALFLAALVLAGAPHAAAWGLPAPADAASEAAAYAALDAVRDGRRDDLVAWFDRIAADAKAVARDEAMQRYFLVKSRYHQLRRQETPPAEAVAAVEELKESIRRHCLERYGMFYDILFVDRSGFVISSIRRQGDYHQDLFAGDLRQTALVRHLIEHPDEAFVDYEYYAVSDEPSAFFVEPMIADGERRGWFVLQCAINKVNRIFARDEGLGRTGEVFLVNRQHQMLTDSRLRPEPSILRRHLSRENIEAKFAERRGHKVVTDYRGYRALTSFEVCPLMGTEWLLIAKIDRDEVMTRRYLEDAASLARVLPARAAAAAAAAEAPAVSRQPVVVDLDEFRKNLPGRELATYGVSTCTAVLFELPGEFAYLGHASAYDRMYGQGELDMVGNLFDRIRTFEILPWQQRAMRVTLVAPHAESFAPAVATLLEAGFLLSQIRFCHEPDARSATVVHDPDSGATWVGWRPADGDGSVAWRRADREPDLGALIDLP
jgi:hypothetical protein